MTAAGFPAAFARLPPPLTAGSRFVAALCLALLCVLALPALAQAQTTVTLVSNTGKTAGGANTISSSFSFAQAFDTGSNAGGYNLASIVVSLVAPTGSGTVTATVRADDSGNPSSTVLYTLTTPTLGHGSNEFTAPANATLNAGATYHVVLAFSASSGGPRWVRTAISQGLDAGASPGWDIDAGALRYSAFLTAWDLVSSSQSFQLQVKGSLPDTTAPRVTSIEYGGTQISPTHQDIVEWEVTFNEDVKNVDATDFEVSNTSAMLDVESRGDASVYTVQLSGGDLADLDATITLSFASGQNIQDLASNDLTNTTPTGTNESSVVVDNTAPTVTSIERVTPTTSPTNVNSLSWQVTFSEALPFTSPGPGTDDFVVSGTTGSFFIQPGSSTEFIVGVSGGDLDDLNDTVTLSFATGQNITDPAGNALVNVTPTSGTNDNFFVVDNTAPTVTITATSTSTGPFTATFTFDEAVTGFASGDITVGNGAPSNLQNPSSDNRTFTATITPVATGTVTVNVAANVAEDAAGIGNTAAIQVSISHTASVADTTAPTVTSIVRQDPATSPTNANTLTWRVTFNENVKDIGDADFAITGTTASLGVVPMTGSTSVYDVTASGGDLDGLTDTVMLSFATGQNIKDIANNNLTNTTPTGTDESDWVVDNTAPTAEKIERESPTTSPTNADTLTWLVTFSEDVQNVNDFDFSVTGTTASRVITRVSNDVYQVSISSTGTNDLGDLNATVTLSFTTDLINLNITDTAGNDLVTSGTPVPNDNTYEVDNAAPTVTITDVPMDSTGAFTATFTFNEAVNDFIVGDITVGNGTAAAFTGMNGDTEFTAQITPTANGTVTVDVAVDVATDPAGNGNTAATRVSSTYMAPVADTTAPRVTSIERNTPTTTPTNADTLTWRVTFNEDVKDVGYADFAIAGTTETLTLSASALLGSASQYDVTVSGAALADLDATLTLSFASGQDIKDIANNNLTDTAPTGTNDVTFVVDNTAPTVTITDVPMDSTGAFPATFTFDEAVNDFVVGDITVGNGTASNLQNPSSDNRTFTATITPASTGTVTVDVAANTATDAAGNGNTAATQVSSAYMAPGTPPPPPPPDPEPGPPENLEAAAGGGAVTLGWEAPVDPGASAIVRYEVRHASGDSVPENTAWQSVGLNLSHTITGLTNGQVYAFEVRAVNSSNPAEGPAARVQATPTESPLVSLTPGRLIVAENAGAAVLTVSLNRPASSALSVLWYTQDDHAEAPNDYTAREGSLTFATGDHRKTISIPIVEDAVREDPVQGVHETFFVILRAGQSYSRSDSSYALVEIVDNDGDAPPDVTPPQLTQVTANGSTLVLTYNEPLDGTSTPAPGDFAVTVAGGPGRFLARDPRQRRARDRGHGDPDAGRCGAERPGGHGGLHAGGEPDPGRGGERRFGACLKPGDGHPGARSC